MDETRELTVANLQKSLLGVREVRTRHPQVWEVSRLLVTPELPLDTLAGLSLEWLLSVLGFERGYFAIGRPGSRQHLLDDRGASRLEVVVSRRTLPDSHPPSWAPVPNAGFSLHRTVLARALASPDPVAIDDCLVPPGPGEGELHRAVLCGSFTVHAETMGAIYLDRGLGGPKLGEDEREIFSEFLTTCAPLFSRAFLAEELARLKGSAEPSTPGEPEEPEPARGDGEVPPASPLERAGDVPSYHGIIGRDEKLAKIFQIVEKVKNTNLNVCVFGESGTGKELVARAIHAAGNRQEFAFVSENCGAISENLLESELFGHVKGAFTGADEDRKGLFEIADKGTLFLDEIGDMSEGMQRKLLRALQEGTIRPIGSKNSIHVDVRVICASNRDLKHLVREGSFRADLYYRLNVIQIHVPPLRERRGDIPLLLDAFARETAEEEGIAKRFGDSALRALTGYSWPGNVRELRNVVRRVFLTSSGRVIARKEVLPFLSDARAAVAVGENLEREDDHLLLRIPLRESFNEIVEECERLILLNALRENSWNKSRVTKVLRIPRQSLYNKISKYDLHRGR